MNRQIILIDQPPLKPTIDQVTDEFYLKLGDMKQARDEAEHFFNYYESCNWKVGPKKRMTSLKGSVNNWMKNKKRYAKQKPKPKKDQWDSIRSSELYKNL